MKQPSADSVTTPSLLTSGFIAVTSVAPKAALTALVAAVVTITQTPVRIENSYGIHGIENAGPD